VAFFLPIPGSGPRANPSLPLRTSLRKLSQYSVLYSPDRFNATVLFHLTWMSNVRKPQGLEFAPAADINAQSGLLTLNPTCDVLSRPGYN